MTKIRLGVLAFGRIGRAIVIASEKEEEFSDIEVVAIGDHEHPHKLDSIQDGMMHDSVHGWSGITPTYNDGHIGFGSANIAYIKATRPDETNWSKHNVDVVVDTSGVHTTHNALQGHLSSNTEDSKVKLVMLTAPSKDERVPRYVFNANQLGDSSIISNTSCTTNAACSLLSCVLKVFSPDEIRSIDFFTVHDGTNSNPGIDNVSVSGKKRSVEGNILITTTGASKGILEIYPELEGKVFADAVRVRTKGGSFLRAVISLEKNSATNFQRLDYAIGKFHEENRIDLNNHIDCTNRITTNPHVTSMHTSSISMDARGYKVNMFYDNEYGYACNALRVIRAQFEKNQKQNASAPREKAL